MKHEKNTKTSDNKIFVHIRDAYEFFCGTLTITLFTSV